MKRNQDLRRRLIAAERLGNRVGVLDNLLRMRRRRMTLGQSLVIFCQLGALQLIHLKPQHVELVLAPRRFEI